MGRTAYIRGAPTREYKHTNTHKHTQTETDTQLGPTKLYFNETEYGTILDTLPYGKVNGKVYIKYTQQACCLPVAVT